MISERIRGPSPKQMMNSSMGWLQFEMVGGIGPLPLAGNGEKGKGSGKFLGKEEVGEEREEIGIEIGIGSGIGEKGTWVGGRKEEEEEEEELGDQRRE